MYEVTTIIWKLVLHKLSHVYHLLRSSTFIRSRALRSGPIFNDIRDILLTIKEFILTKNNLRCENKYN